VNKDWVAIKVPENLEEMIDAMIQSTEERIGWCLLCNRPINSEADLIPRSNTHDCRAFKSVRRSNATESDGGT